MAARAAYLAIRAERRINEQRVPERDEGVGLGARARSSGAVTTSKDKSREEQQQTLPAYDAWVSPHDTEALPPVAANARCMGRSVPAVPCQQTTAFGDELL